MKVLMITSEYPTKEAPFRVPFIVRQIKFLQMKGIDVHVLSFRGAKNPINYFSTFLKVQKLLHSTSFDLVHAQFGQSGLFTFFNKIPMVVTFRGSDLEGIIGNKGQFTIAGKILQMLSKLVIMRAQTIILVAENMARFLPKTQSYHVIPSGLDLELFYPMDRSLCRQKLGWSIDSKIVLFGGRPYVKRKRYDLAVQVVKLAKSKIELKSLDDVLPEAVPVIMNAADLLLLTSIHEGSPNVVKEALACNTPIVSVAVGDVKERLKGIKGCYICENDNPEEIAKLLDTALTSRETAFEGRKYVQHLDENLLADQVIKIYRDISST